MVKVPFELLSRAIRPSFEATTLPLYMVKFPYSMVSFATPFSAINADAAGADEYPISLRKSAATKLSSFSYVLMDSTELLTVTLSM